MRQTNQMLIAVGLFMLSAIAFVFTIGLALLPVGGGQVVSPVLGTYRIGIQSLGSPVADALVYALLPIPLIITLEGALWRLREVLIMREEALKYRPKTVWAVFADFRKFWDIFNAAVFLVIFIILITLLIHEISYFPKAISKNIILYAATIIVYFATRKATKNIWKGTSKRFRRGLPTYRLVKDGIFINLFPNSEKRFPNLQPVHIRFEEIEDLLVMTFTESEAFLKYNIGPDFQLSSRQIRDTAAYLKGEIARPSVYTYGGAKNDCVLIRGPELFYMISFDAEDVSALEEAYKSFKGAVKESPLQQLR